MNYFIFKNGALMQVTEEEYYFWEQNEMPKEFLPDYQRKIGESVFHLETIFSGSVDEDEELLPFILVYSMDELNVHDEGVARRLKDEKIEYFGSIEELIFRRKQLIDLLEEGNLDW